MELDARGFIGSGISLIFVFFLWKIPTWQNSTFFTWKLKLAMSIALPIIAYFVTVFQVNR